MMDKPQKRRVLSLSLSQPGKQHKKLKLKRHASANSQNNSKASDSEDSQQISDLRNDKSVKVPQSCPITSTLPEVAVANTSTPSGRETTNEPHEDVCEEPISEHDGYLEEKKSPSPGSFFREESACDRQSLEVKDIKTEVSVERTANYDKHDKVPLKERPLNSTTHSLHVDLRTVNDKTDSKLPQRTGTLLDSAIAFSMDTDSLRLKEESCVANALVIPVNAAENSTTTGVQKEPENTKSMKEFIEVLQCPLCTRNFDKLSTKTAHLKGCAAKHKLTTQQLLEVVELQQRQAAERKALGLPVVSPAVGNIKKAVAPRKENRANPKLDSNLQLAMALSLSLQEQEKAIEFCRSADSTKGISLDHFGFTSKSVLEGVQPRPDIPVTRGKTKTMEKKTLPLLTRTSEERQRIITEKVAMVLLEEAAVGKSETTQIVNLKSTFLQECLHEENCLWDKSHTSPSKSDRSSYYVKDLRGVISPSKVETGSKVMHLSQVVGRVTTPTKVQKQQEPDEILLSSPSDEENSSDCSSHQQKESKSAPHIEMELRAKLFNDWAGMVNNSTMSDLTIYPQEGREIPSHKIILHVRCPRILRDISRQRNPLTGNEVEVIMWSKVPHVAALAFLEYIYCGSVKSIRVISEDLSSIIWLANHYKITDLLRYLRAVSECAETCETPSQVALSVVRDCDKLVSECAKSCETPSQVDLSVVRGCNKLVPECANSCETPSQVALSVVRDCGTVSVSLDVNHVDTHDGLEGSENCTEVANGTLTKNYLTTPVGKEGKNACLKKHPRTSMDIFASPVSTPTRSETESIYSEMTLPGEEIRSSCSSPDMFDDDEEVEEMVERAEPNSKDHVSAADGLSERHSPLESTMRNEDRPPSVCASISSEKTVIVGRNSRNHSERASISSDKTDILEKISRTPSPNLSNASAATEVLECNQECSKQTTFSLNDSKRKHSDSSQDDGLSICKRPCPVNSSPNCEPEKNESDVECLDLTQDSDSNASRPVSGINSSGQSSEKICISSDNELSDNDTNSKKSVHNEPKKDKEMEAMTSSYQRQSIECDKMGYHSEEVTDSHTDQTEKAAEPYVSPVWDGFEELNYDDPFLFSEAPVNFGSSPEKPLSLNNATKMSSLSPTDTPHKQISKGQRESVSPKRDEELPENDKESESSSGCEMTYQSPSVVQRKPQPSATFEALLDDSLVVNDSILRQAESEFHGKLTQRETKGTPLNRVLSSGQDAVTPLANYSAMKTPELKRELQKFGLKPTLGKRKGKIMLRHIYNELHPWIPGDSETNFQDRVSLSQPSCSSEASKQTRPSSQPNSRKLKFAGSKSEENDVNHGPNEGSTESDSDSDDSMSSVNASIQEIQFLEGDCDDVEPLTQASQPVNKSNLSKVVTDFIINDRELHQKVLEYEPIWIDQLRNDLRSNGFKFKMVDLMAFLDEKCITFRSAQSGPRVKKRRQKTSNPRKKTAVVTGSDNYEQTD